MASHVFDLIAQEELRQETTVELIASENFAAAMYCGRWAAA